MTATPSAGPLTPLLADARVSEVLVTAGGAVYVERAGRLGRVGVDLRDPVEARQLAVRLAALCGRRLDDASPIVDGRLPDGSRLNAALPPVSVDGPVIAIRRFGRRPLTLDDLVAGGSIAPDDGARLVEAVRARRTILIAGGTSSGKTTLLGALGGVFGEAERVVSVEDTAELRILAEHVVRLETRPPNVEGRGEIDLRALLRAALRMRPDRLVVGEVRGAEALDLVLALTTGHDGSLATIHASSAADALRRLELLALLGGPDVPHAAIREQVACGVHLVVHLERSAAGGRRLAEIARVERAPAGGWSLVAEGGGRVAAP